MGGSQQHAFNTITETKQGSFLFSFLNFKIEIEILGNFLGEDSQLRVLSLPMTPMDTPTV